MANFRKYPDRVIVDKDGGDLASTAATALRVTQVDANGAAVATQSPTFAVRTASTAAVAEAVNPTGTFRLLRVEAKFSAAATAAENFTVTIDAGDGANYDSLIYSESMSALAATNISIPFGKGYEYEADDDVDLGFTNSENNTITTRTVYELL
ncbi:hypothetical protein CMI37_31825 [Candidatus Pacearchaeota archaeon]|nr:hypothetical protein [Candidatus Pacearchaeota archaeon]|tara:strand:- start:1531 stop:1989 length:459 start_codon:yes stop_codon:yes gene_type:complete